MFSGLKVIAFFLSTDKGFSSIFAQNNPMKFHFPLVDAVRFALSEIFEQNHQADRVIERILKSNPKMGARDRAFVAETTYDIVRWWRLLNEVAENNYQTDGKSLLDIISAYFLIFHDERPQWKENYGFDFIAAKKRYDELTANPAVANSIPDWLQQIGEKELGERWNKEMQALNRQAEVCLRVNKLKTDKEALTKMLQRENIKVHDGQLAADAVILDERMNVFKSEAFKSGLFEVQDEGSQCIPEFSGVKPGMRVIDACAGAGGKTLQLAAMMENKGRIIAMDVDEYKLAELKKRAKRNGASIIEPRKIESSKTIKRLAESADLVLLDVPCSGLGTLRRNPDAKWKLKPEFMRQVQEKQQEILQQYAKMVKPEGVLVYATCSILPAENENQVRSFLEKNAEFQLADERKLSPADNGCDGFYMAKMIRRN